MVWNGQQVELVVTFATPTILNRFQLELILAELLYDNRSLDGSSNKFSGDVVIDFDPRHVKQMRIVISDGAGAERIALRGIHFYARQFQTIGAFTTAKIDNMALGFVRFLASQAVTTELTNITHQISYDGVHFSGITPGDTFDIGGSAFWYRAYLERLDSNFDSRSKPLPTSGQDPVAAAYYRIGSIKAIDVGNNILERTITLDLLSQATQSPRILALREFPLPGTLSVYQGRRTAGPARIHVPE